MYNQPTCTVGIVGARGYAGAELIGLIDRHPHMTLGFAASRSRVGEEVPGQGGLKFTSAEPEHIANFGVDAVVLAVPDGASHEYIDQLDDRIIVDLSSDHRFDDDWAYGLSELNADRLDGATKISNPGCYATALQLAAFPLLRHLEGPIHAFGVSGYSGAGTTPSDRNNMGLLSGGITPYAMVDHTHERESTRHLNHPVRFTPHVAPFFRGIVLTLHGHIKAPASIDSLVELYMRTYMDSELIEVLGEQVPRVQEIENRMGAQIGGICIGSDQHSVTAICVIDNLLKGAASQAIQNLNIALGLSRDTGLSQEVLA